MSIHHLHVLSFIIVIFVIVCLHLLDEDFEIFAVFVIVTKMNLFQYIFLKPL